MQLTEGIVVLDNNNGSFFVNQTSNFIIEVNKL